MQLVLYCREVVEENWFFSESVAIVLQDEARLWLAVVFLACIEQALAIPRIPSTISLMALTEELLV